MICLVGFAVFAFLGIFSATYRSYTLDAWECMKSKASNSPCESGFDERYRAFAVDNAMKVDMRLARFVKNYFEELNWIIFILFGVLTLFTLEGAYNLILHGTCDPTGGCSIEQGLEWLR